jgi:hypothetical protein
VTASSNTPIWKRALLRGAGAALLLFIAFEALILAGKTEKIDSGEALVIATAAGGVYAGLWSIFALIVARTLAKIEKRGGR